MATARETQGDQVTRKSRAVPNINNSFATFGLYLTGTYNKTIKACLFCVTSDLSVLACGLVAKNSALGLRSRVLFLATRLQARTDKSDVTLEAMP